MSDQKKAKNKPKQEASRNGPDGEAKNSEEPDQTGSSRDSLFVCFESTAV